ncbi:hypothetical protein HJFPF1_02875 [Paramyrothecium foliicola]|nr:hypothetical protein HJFPF1_02875 [Paramyrothecium foliicola]
MPHPSSTEKFYWGRRCKSQEATRNSESTTASSDLLKEDDIVQDLSQDERSLLDLCDSIRSNLQEQKDLGPRAEEARAFIGNTMKREYEEILVPENHPSPLPIDFRVDVSIARSLQRQWRTRFRESYTDIDQLRYLDLPKNGRLKDVVFATADEHDTQLWHPKNCDIIPELGGNIQFEAGQ